MTPQACKPACTGDFEMCNLPAGQPGQTQCETCGDPNSSAQMVNNCCNTGKVHGTVAHVHQYCYNRVCNTEDGTTDKYLTCGEECGSLRKPCCDSHHPMGRCPFPDGNQRLVPQSNVCQPCGQDNQLVCTDGKACDDGLLVTEDGLNCRTLPSAHDWPTCKPDWKCEDHFISTNCVQNEQGTLDHIMGDTHGLKVDVKFTGANPRHYPCIGGCKKHWDGGQQTCRVLLAGHEKPTN